MNMQKTQEKSYEKSYEPDLTILASKQMSVVFPMVDYYIPFMALLIIQDTIMLIR